jgi:eukaryotic-like serine/threonine-protein kinase
MSDPDHNTDETLPRPQEQSVTYRCVCGEMICFRSGAAVCPVCERNYDSDVLRVATAATVEIHPDSVSSDVDLAIEVDTDDLVGTRVGHFQILNRLGSGGMGAVYRALDESLQRYVAVKVLRGPAGGSDDTNLQQLFQEARAQARVNHPHVAHIYYVGSEAETPYLAMELVGNETLADRLAGGPLPFPVIIRYALQVAEALEAAAKFDIIHGDVKPANVLMVDEQTLKLSDFGLSRRLSEVTGASTTAAGTPDYISPEAAQGHKIDHRGDMYSLGVTLFQLTFGRMPYTPSTSNIEERLRLHCFAEVEFPDVWPPELPLGWRELLEKLLEKEPSKRHASFAELIADLKRLEPTSLPTASPLLRGFAWLFDGFLVSMPLAIIALIFTAGPRTIFGLIGTALSAAVALGICALQASWGTTPGKRLFQIRIVDQHGLSPPKPVLTARAAFQFAWAWAFVVASALQHLSLDFFGELLIGLVPLFIAVEMGFVLFAKGRSLHDRLFRTQVVLDAVVRSSE